MAEDSELDVLVVGAGPTGLTLAGQLQAMGTTVRIVDRQADRVQESRALAVQPRTLEVLRGLGVTAQLVDEGNRAMEVELRTGRRRSRIRCSTSAWRTRPSRSCCSFRRPKPNGS